MRVYLDTNILVFLFQKSNGELSPNTIGIVEDYANTLATSSVCVEEFIHLCQIGKVFGDRRKKETVSAESVLPWLREMGITICSVTERHLDVFASLPMFADHRDPADRLIISQAISDRIPLVSSDLKFARYKKYGLDFIRNMR